MKAALRARAMKTDRRDARGMAQMLRMAWFRPVHAKTIPAQEIRALLVARKLLLARLKDIELGLRGIVRGFGLKLGGVARGRFEARVRALVAGHRTLESLAEPMLRARAALRAEYAALPAPRGAADRAAGCGLPADDDGPRRRRDRGRDLQGGGR